MRRAWRLQLSLLWLILVVTLAILAPFVAGEDPYRPVAAPLLSIQQHPPLGTDHLGRDLWARLAFGARWSLMASALATLVTLITGTALALLSTAGGRILDHFILGASNAALAIPGLLFAMLLVAAMGPSYLTIILAVGFGAVPGFIRLSRVLFSQILEQHFVEAARALGAGPIRIAIVHLLPNAAGQLLSLATTHFAWAFMGATTLSFLGFSGDPSIPEWGAMLDAGRGYLAEAPRLSILPGLLISLTILAVHRWGEHLANRTTQG